MPKPQVQSLEAGEEMIKDMMHMLSDPDGFGFSPKALDHNTLKLLRVERSEDAKTSKIVLEMQVQPAQCNGLSNLHGGAAATIIDNLTSLALYLHTSGTMGDPWSMLGVSHTLSVQYIAPVPAGSYIDIECRVLQVGKSVTLLAAEIWRKDGPVSEGGKRVQLTTVGNHTKVDNSSKVKL